MGMPLNLNRGNILPFAVKTYNNSFLTKIPKALSRSRIPAAEPLPSPVVPARSKRHRNFDGVLESLREKRWDLHHFLFSAKKSFQSVLVGVSYVIPRHTYHNWRQPRFHGDTILMISQYLIQFSITSGSL